MSELAAAIAARLRKPDLQQEVDDLLLAERVPTTTASPSPVHLHVTRIAFSGVKRFEEAAVGRDGTTAVVRPVPVREEPFAFEWDLGPGVYVLGSHDNLRGKSSVLEVMRWALRGRCQLDDVVLSWVHHVSVAFQVGSERLTVEFEVSEGRPSGAVFKDGGSGRVQLAAFDGDETFEQTMQAIMMPRLHLIPVVAWQEEQVVEHAWPAYAAALSVSSKGLDALVGDVVFGLSGPLLSMFVGSAWQASRAQARTASQSAEARLARLDARANAEHAASRERRQEAQARVDEAQAQLNTLPHIVGHLDEASTAILRAGRLGEEVASLQIDLEAARAALRDAEGQLREEEGRRQQELEDAHAKRFFGRLRPTVCPRCETPVTEERRAAEAALHHCSVCTSEVTGATSVEDPIPVENELGSSDADNADDADIDVDEPTDVEEALRATMAAATRRVQELIAQLAERNDTRQESVEAVRRGDLATGVGARRRELELELARAQGALEALGPAPTPVDAEEVQRLRHQLKVLKAAEAVCGDWVQREHAPILPRISAEILRLATAFGVPHLTSATLRGGAQLLLRQGAADTSYSRVPPGEKLRLKIATAVSLLRVGFTTGVGRHPGLLTVDSPGSEEMTKASFDAMLDALITVASETGDAQVIIATTKVDTLQHLLPEKHYKIAGPGEYLW